MEQHTKDKVQTKSVLVNTAKVKLDGIISIPVNSKGIVLFAHGSGSSRLSPRNQFVAEVMNKKGIATLLFDLLTSEEEKIDMVTAHLRFDIDFLAQRLSDVTDWVLNQPQTKDLNIGYFGASTGAGAALVTASRRPDVAKAIVSRGGRPDLAGASLAGVKCPTLLIVGENDRAVIELNKIAMKQLRVEKILVIVPGATHLFEEKGKLEEVAKHACDWFEKHLGGRLDL